MHFASANETQAFSLAHDARPDFYREAEGLTLSSVGVGTYLGNADDATDARYASAITHAVALGVNVIDTAANYRFQRSERAIGQALRSLASEGVDRQSLFLCSKAGFLAFDGAPPTNPKAWFEETFVVPGIADYVDVVQGVHCMAPRYLKHQLGQSLKNLGVAALDIYYVHNPETQLALLTRPAFYKRLREAFAVMEEEVAAGRIKQYGIATWDGFRVPPEDGRYLDLGEVLRTAKEAAGGSDHHCRFVQLPYNMAMTEAYTLANQAERTFLEAAIAEGIRVVTSAGLMQSRILGHVPESMRALAQTRTDAQTALQFARSAPGVLAALAGMSQIAHANENLALRESPPVAHDNYERFFG